MAVHFKFKSAKDYDSINIDGHFISVANLKDRIFERKSLGSGTDFDLHITDAQTGEGMRNTNVYKLKFDFPICASSAVWSSEYLKFVFQLSHR